MAWFGYCILILSLIFCFCFYFPEMKIDPIYNLTGFEWKKYELYIKQFILKYLLATTPLSPLISLFDFFFNVDKIAN